MLVLSAAVLVIVIDARCGDGARWGDHEGHELHEKGIGGGGIAVIGLGWEFCVGGGFGVGW